MISAWEQQFNIHCSSAGGLRAFFKTCLRKTASVLFSYWSHQISSPFQWVDVTHDSVWVSSSHIIIIQMIQCQYCSHDNTFYQTALFVTEMIQTVFVYRKCSACRTGTTGSRGPPRRNSFTMSNKPEAWANTSCSECESVSVTVAQSVFTQTQNQKWQTQYFTMKVTVMLFHVLMNCGRYYCVRQEQTVSLSFIVLLQTVRWQDEYLTWSVLLMYLLICLMMVMISLLQHSRL